MINKERRKALEDYLKADEMANKLEQQASDSKYLDAKKEAERLKAKFDTFKNL